MASKKHILVVALIVLIQSVGLAQTDWGWDWKDTSKISVTNMPQHNEFLNNQYPYPSMPRNQWEFGIGIGAAALSSDFGTDLGFGGTVTLRKALNHTFSLRPYVSYYVNDGKGTATYLNNVIAPNFNNGDKLAYKNNSLHFGLDVLTSLNTASYYRGNPKTNFYAITGLEYYTTSRKQQVNNGVFTDYKSVGQNTGVLSAIGINVGLGMAFKINNSVNIAFEAKNTLTNNDYLDTYSSVWSNAFDAWWYTGVKLNINLGNKAKRVQPLWWLNPNNFVYSELNSPKHMKLPKVVLPDADGDGITDQFDLEPNTPKGAPVDSHGVAKDTDGDGVPDYRDKEVLTPKNCFPVNNDGVGSCPEPACCKEIKDMMANWKPQADKTVACNIGNLPSIQFKGNAKLSKDAMSSLASAAAKVNANPTCKVKVIGYGAASKAAQQLSWERVNAVIKYLVEKQGVSESRLLFVYAQDGDANTVDLQGTVEEGPNTVPAPHPNLRSKN